SFERPSSPGLKKSSHFLLWASAHTSVVNSNSSWSFSKSSFGVSQQSLFWLKCTVLVMVLTPHSASNWSSVVGCCWLGGLRCACPDGIQRALRSPLVASTSQTWLPTKRPFLDPEFCQRLQRLLGGAASGDLRRLLPEQNRRSKEPETVLVGDK